MKTRKSKVVSFRLTVKEYANLLLESVEGDEDLSRIVKDRFWDSYEIPGIKKELNNLEEIRGSLKKEIEVKEHKVKHLLEMHKTAKKDLKDKSSELEKSQKMVSVLKKNAEKRLKEIETANILKKTLDTKVKNLGVELDKSNQKTIELEKANTKLKERIKAANAYIKEDAENKIFKSEFPVF